MTGSDRMGTPTTLLVFPSVNIDKDLQPSSVDYPHSCTDVCLYMCVRVCTCMYTFVVEDTRVDTWVCCVCVGHPRPLVDGDSSCMWK